MKVWHYPWSHFSLPFRIRRWGGDFFFKQEITMTEVDYIHEPDEDNDQYDWNKLTGVKDHYFRPREDTLMIGWRWNPDTQLCEFNFYRHENGGTDKGPVELVCPEGGTIVVTMNRNRLYTDGIIIVRMWIKGEPENVRSSEIRIDGGCWLVNHWFGGDRKPKKRVKFRVKKSTRYEPNPHAN